jgi:hypothetical protein
MLISLYTAVGGRLHCCLAQFKAVFLQWPICQSGFDLWQAESVLMHLCVFHSPSNMC